MRLRSVLSNYRFQFFNFQLPEYSFDSLESFDDAWKNIGDQVKSLISAARSDFSRKKLHKIILKRHETIQSIDRNSVIVFLWHSEVIEFRLFQVDADHCEKLVCILSNEP